MHKPILLRLHPHPIFRQYWPPWGDLTNKSSSSRGWLGRLRDKDESGCKEKEEVTVFNDETTIDVDVDALGKDVVWQEEGLEFEDVEEPGEDEVKQA
jgi:hypothetical protein